MKRPFLRFMGLWSIFSLSACVPIQTLGRGTLVVKPNFPTRTTQATVMPYTKEAIQHLVIKLYTEDGGSHDTGVQSDILYAQLDNPIVFSSLKPHTTYRIKGYAYKAAGTSAPDLISDEGSSSVDVGVVDNDRPTLSTLKVVLIDRPFNAQATGSVSIVPGGYSPIGTEKMEKPPAVVTTLAGDGTAGCINGPAASARFNNPYDVAADAQGNVYIADTHNFKIRKITPSGSVSTLAGGTTYGFVDGTGTEALMGSPVAITVDATGNLYFVDDGSKRIRKISPAGVLTTLAGNGTLSFADGPGTQASFYFPYGIAVDAQGNVYVGDGNNHRIRKIDQNNYVTTFAGDGVADFREGTGTQARFNFPNRIAMGAGRYLYIADQNNYRVRKIDTQTGVVSTLAGDGTKETRNGVGTQAHFFSVTEVAADDFGNVYVVDNNAIRKIDSNSVVTSFAGAPTTGYLDGTGTNALFNPPYGLGSDPYGNLYVADKSNQRIRKVQ